MGLCVGASRDVLSQDPDYGGDRFKPYLKLVQSTYLPADQGGGSQVIRLKFDLSPDVPVGTKIHMRLLHHGIETEHADRFVQGVDQVLTEA